MTLKSDMCMHAIFDIFMLLGNFTAVKKDLNIST